MEKVKVTGVKWFDGEIDGKKINSGTAFVEERLDERRGTAKGRAATAYKLSSAAAAQTLARREFPLICEVEFDRVTDGKGNSETIIADIRPAIEGVETAPAAGNKKAA